MVKSRNIPKRIEIGPQLAFTIGGIGWWLIGIILIGIIYLRIYLNYIGKC